MLRIPERSPCIHDSEVTTGHPGLQFVLFQPLDIERIDFSPDFVALVKPLHLGLGGLEYTSAVLPVFSAAAILGSRT